MSHIGLHDPTRIDILRGQLVNINFDISMARLNCEDKNLQNKMEQIKKMDT